MGKEGTQVPIDRNFNKNIEYLKKELRVDKNFDLIHHKMEHGGLKIGHFYIDAFASDKPMIDTLKSFKFLDDEEFRKDPVEALTQTIIPHQEIDTSEDLEEVIAQILAGQSAFIIEGVTQAVLVDTRTYPARSPQEPDLERVVRGPRDGFVETIVFNTALIRRHVRDRSLIFEYLQVGQRSKKDISLTYLDSVVDPELIRRLKEEIEKIDIDDLSMGEKTLEEYIFGRSMNPYPLVRYTERGDTAGVHLMEGHILIIVDGSPSVMICPSTFWHHLQHAEEYRQKPVVGAFLRWVRFVAVFSGLFLLPLWYLLASNPELLPNQISFLGLKEEGNVPLFLQFLIAEIGVEMLRMAAIHTPNALATALGLIAALMIGEIAIDVGLFSSEVILYLAIAVIGNYATPSYELSLSNRLTRLFLLIVTATFGVYGFVLGFVAWLLLLVSTKALNTPYLWPFIPFNAKAFFVSIVRSPMPLQKSRPSVLNTLDDSRQEGES
ncbi:spore germination protein [Tenuibacillus multivorans]|uniref:Stage V sporulation protein AF n=1 Tax=Tenuibacillus multivorans TaxID=237069 RepID=A0A1H0AKZ1_9BACI|nr:spore germination protein [Tenuibacillus multivorans]GEL78191.1 spore germination protein [Tenuibacillus multivorans]SDN34200.1 stage V sporulation protein AF [Tenuibacillus multivorans]